MESTTERTAAVRQAHRIHRFITTGWPMSVDSDDEYAQLDALVGDNADLRTLVDDIIDR